MKNILKTWFKKQTDTDQSVVMSEYYKQWRIPLFKASQSLSSHGLQPEITGVIMDFGMIDQKSGARFVLSTAAFANGQAGFYPSPGGATSGLEQHPHVADAARDIVKMGKALLGSSKKTEDFSLPIPGMAYYYFLTTDGIFLFQESIEKLMLPNHPFFDLLRAFSFIRKFGEDSIDQRMVNPS